MGPLCRKKRELEERKKFILEKSRDLFFQKGFDGVTIQDICEAVEYGKSVIYSMFENKEEIYSYIYIDAVKIISILMESIDPQGDFDIEFSKIGEMIFRFYSDYNDYYMAISFFNNNSMAHSKIPPHIKEEKEKIFEESGKNFEKLMQRSIKNDLIKQINIEEFIMLFYSAIFGIIGLFIYTEDEEDKEKIRNAVITHTELYKEGLKR